MFGISRSRLGALLSLTTALLVSVCAVAPQPASAQSTSFDVDDPLTSLRDANATTDAELVDLATAFMKARADTKISHATYRKGIRFFRQNHPGFYGNFFGDPFYATYDARYFNLAWDRRFAELKINPGNGIVSQPSFFCNPTGYDPAFNGVCTGYSFRTSDFFLLPISVKGSPDRLLSSSSAPVRRTGENENAPRREVTGISPDRNPRRIPDPPPRDADSSHVESTGLTAPDEDQPSARPAVSVESGGELDRLPDKIDLPDEAYTSMQRRAQAFKRTEIVLRLQRRLDFARSDGEELSAQKRHELASQLANRLSSPSRQDAFLSRMRRLSDERHRDVGSRGRHGRAVDNDARRRLDATEILRDRASSETSSERRPRAQTRENSDDPSARSDRSSRSSERSSRSKKSGGERGNS